MGVNVIFNDINYQVLPKQQEQFDKYCKILQWGRQHPTRFAEQFMNLQLTDMQKWVVLNSWLPSNVVWCMSRSTGKLIPLDTYIPTMKNNMSRLSYEKLENLKNGDKIYGLNGKITTIKYLHPIVFEDVWEIELENGEILECGPEHLWSVYDFGLKSNEPRKNKIGNPVVYETQQMYSLGTKMWNNKRVRFGIPVNSPLEYKEHKYIIEPYLLGLWLGDGSKKERFIACDAQDSKNELKILNNINENEWIFEYNEQVKDSYGYIKISHKNDNINGRRKEFLERLRKLKVFNDKHIPEVYFHGSYQQRLELLQGLMDSDGYCDTNGSSEFCQVDEKLAYQVFRLIRELGIKATINKRKKITRKNKIENYAFKINFTLDKSIPVFKLERKYNRMRKLSSIKSKYWSIKEIRHTTKKKPMRCITVDNEDGTFLIGKNYIVTHNSYMASIFIMLRSLLFPSHNSYIMAPSGQQSQETFTKLENIAKNNIASAIGVTSVFIDECKRMNSKADPFTHNAQGYEVSLYNGSTIHSLNSVAKNIVGIRSQLNVYDEAGKIDPEFFALTQPFTAQDADFKTGAGINLELFPKQVQNKTLYSSSAEGIDSELFKQYKLSFQKMLLGDPDYFVADIDCTFSLKPYMNGKPSPPQLSQKVIDNAMETNPFKAKREYFNIFDSEQSDSCFVKRLVIDKFSESYFPEFENRNGKAKYIIAYDPASKLDNSIIMIGELFRDSEKGLMLKLVNCINLIEVLKNGEKRVIQAPEQVQRLKDIIADYNKGASNYDNIQRVKIDAGAGGGGFQISQYLLQQYKDKYNNFMPGMIDTTDPYMAIREDDFPGADNRVLRMVNFKKDKTNIYEATQNMINQGLVVFTQDLNIRQELMFSKLKEDGSYETRYEKANYDEVNALTQFSLLKEEVAGMQKVKKQNGTIVFEQTIEAKQQGKHDDRVDCLCMLCSELAEMRAEEALAQVEKPKTEYKEMLAKIQGKNKKSTNPFGNLGNNPFAGNRKSLFS